MFYSLFLLVPALGDVTCSTKKRLDSRYRSVRILIPGYLGPWAIFCEAFVTFLRSWMSMAEA